jgi:thiol-disulfide isomerase/thioredoxin
MTPGTRVTSVVPVTATTVLIVLAGLVLGATVIGVLQRILAGRVRHTPDSRIVAIDGIALGHRATLLQFSTQVCTPCRSTARVLDQIAAQTPDVAHVDLDVTHRPEVAARFRVMQTPTTLILDADGAIRARIGGAVRRDLVRAELDRVLAAA